MQTLIQDLRYAVRMMRKRAGFTAVVVSTLAIGIGVSTTILSTVNAVLWRPLPFENPDQLVALNESQPKVGKTWLPISIPNLLDWQAHNRVFSEIAPYVRRSYNLNSEDNPERMSGASISHSLFPLLGVEPVVGRPFLPEEDKPNSRSVVLISHQLWRERFDADPGVTGQTLRLNGHLHEIVGVMPPRFEFPEWAKLWTPLALETNEPRRDWRWLEATARLAPGVNLEQARADTASIASQLEKLYPETNTGWRVQVRPLIEQWMPQEAQAGTFSMLGAVGFLMLIISANVANLMLAQAISRRQETALRAALGASRFRVTRQVLTESVLFALLGGLLGILIASWGVEWMENSIPVPIPFWIYFDIDARVLGFTFLVTLLTGIVLGLAPALRAAGSDVYDSLKQGGNRPFGGRERSRVRNLLVAAEFAFSLVLLVGAMLLTKNLLRLQEAEPGYATQNILTMRLSLTGDPFDSERRASFVEDVVERIQALREVEAVGATNHLPASRSGYSLVYLEVEGRSGQVGEEPIATYHAVTERYLDALEIPILQGRMFQGREITEGGDVVLVSRSLAQRLWPERNPLGQRIRNARKKDAAWLRVVGITGDVEPAYQIGGVDSWPEFQIYAPYASHPAPTPTVAIRTASDAPGLVAAAREQVRRVDPSVPVFEMLPMDQVLVQVFWVPRYWSQMFAAFAAIALIVTAVGAYGVAAYSVSQRVHEMGIRMALGAGPNELVKIIVGQGLRIAGLGVAVGLVVALGLARILSILFREVSPTDPAVFGGMSLVLALAAFLANYIPAKRATRVDVVEALKYE